MSDACCVEPIEKRATPDDVQDNWLVLLAVSGLGCPNRAARVRNSLLTVAGVVGVEVHDPLGLAEIVATVNDFEMTRLIQAVVRAGGDGRHAYFARTWSGG